MDVHEIIPVLRYVAPRGGALNDRASVALQSTTSARKAGIKKVVEAQLYGSRVHTLEVTSTAVIGSCFLCICRKTHQETTVTSKQRVERAGMPGSPGMA